MTISLNKTLFVSIFVASAVFLSGCNEERYLARKDSITANLGEAVNTNKATHTVNPWPKGVRNTDLKHDGTVGAKSVGRYQADKVKGFTNDNGDSANKGSINSNPQGEITQ